MLSKTLEIGKDFSDNPPPKTSVFLTLLYDEQSFQLIAAY